MSIYNPSSVRWAKGGVLVIDLPDEMRDGHGMMGGVCRVCNGKGAVGIVGAAPGANVGGGACAGEGAMGIACGGVCTTGDDGSSVGTNNATGGGGARAVGSGARIVEYFWRRGISGGLEGA